MIKIFDSNIKSWLQKAQKISIKVMKEVYEVTGLTL